ncbi:WGR domain-containing protein [Ensifer sp. KUDG1]|uniref:WGR domain-containing protein n=1 Tax=Ensifer sp. KUDG1 TaxID=3373919 RepID=UPI003D22FC6C
MDEILSIGDSHAMLIQPYHLYAERKDPAKNMARYYAIDISLNLFGQACLTGWWGRIGSAGQRMTHRFPDESDAVKHVGVDQQPATQLRNINPVIAARNEAPPEGGARSA